MLNEISVLSRRSSKLSAIILSLVMSTLKLAVSILNVIVSTDVECWPSMSSQGWPRANRKVWLRSSGQVRSSCWSVPQWVKRAWTSRTATWSSATTTWAMKSPPCKPEVSCDGYPPQPGCYSPQQCQQYVTTMQTSSEFSLMQPGCALLLCGQWSHCVHQRWVVMDTTWLSITTMLAIKSPLCKPVVSSVGCNLVTCHNYVSIEAIIVPTSSEFSWVQPGYAPQLCKHWSYYCASQ